MLLKLVILIVDTEDPRPSRVYPFCLNVRYYILCNVSLFFYIDNILPFFDRYPLHGIKSRDFQDFCKVAKIMEDKSHLTPEGINKIKSIKSGMNIGRM